MQNNIDYTKIITELTTRFAKDIIDTGKNKYEKFQVDMGTAFHEYLDAAVKKYGFVKTLINPTIPVALDVFYVETQLSLGKNQAFEVFDITQIVDVSNRTIVTAPAGFGKSIFLKHLFLSALTAGEKVPIFLELRQYNTNNDSFFAFIHNSMQNRKFDLSEDCLEYAFKSGKLLILFDGFDELDSNKADAVKTEIINLCDKYDQNWYIISSRPDPEFISWQNFVELKMLPMTKLTSLKLIGKLNFDEEVKRRFSVQLDSVLYDTHKEFASCPLLLTIMLLTFEQAAEISGEQNAFYRQAFEALYRRHDATKGYKRKMFCDLTESEFVEILSAFALQGYLDNNNNFRRDQMQAYLNTCKELTGIDFNEDEYINDLLKSVCLIIEDGISYMFAHRTFQEYFAACYISRLKDEMQTELLQQLVNRRTVLYNFLFGINKQKFEKNFVIPLLKSIEKETGYQENKERAAFAYVQMIYDRAFCKKGDYSLVHIHANRHIQMGLQIVESLYNRFPRVRPSTLGVLKEYFQIPQKAKVERHSIPISLVFQQERLREVQLSLVDLCSEYKFCMDLLPRLQAENERKDQSLNALLKVQR